jgi:hypothetical protein
MHSKCAWPLLMNCSAYSCAHASLIFAYFVFIWPAPMHIPTVKLSLYMKVYNGIGGTASLIHSFYTKWRWIVSFMLRPPYLPRNSPDSHWMGGLVINTDLHTRSVGCMFHTTSETLKQFSRKFLHYFANGDNRELPVFNVLLSVMCTRWRSRLRHCAISWKVAGSIPDGAIGIFHLHSGPGVDSASNRNEYQENFRGWG